MKLSMKIFLAVFLSSSLAGIAVGLMLYRLARDTREREYLSYYHREIRLLSLSFQALERSSDTLALNAAQVLHERIKGNRPLPSETELTKLASALGVSHLQIADKTGTYLRATDGPGGRNLFLYCPEYKDFFTGKLTRVQTPVIPSAETDTLMKYTLIPSDNRKYVLGVSTDFGFITQFVSEMTQKDPNLERVDFVSPSGRSLGSVIKKHDDIVDLKAPRMTVSDSIPAINADCCECRVKNLTRGDEGFSYHVLATVSLKGFEKDVLQLRWKFGATVLLIILFSFLIARAVTDLILRKLRRISSTIEEVSNTGDFSKKVPLDPESDDELDNLSLRFNQMFDRLKSSQDKIIEAQRVEAQASMAAQVAHDIRSPLTSMGLALSQLRRRLGEQAAMLLDSDSITTDSLSAVASGIERVTGIVKKLSADHSQEKESTSSVETPKLALLDQIIYEIVQETQIKMQRPERLEVTGFSPVHEIWGVVQVHEIQSAVSNILNNALEATEGDQAVKVSIEIDKKKLILTIQDDGVGIPPENLEKIFERKFTAGKPQGTGLGLYQAKAAIEWNDGKITVDSKPGNGSRFTLTLPIEKTPNWVARSIELPATGNLVIADDDPTILTRWKKRVSEIGAYPVTYCTSVADLRRHFSTAQIPENTVLISDQNLGDGKGLEFIAERGFKANTYLCTSVYESPVIQERVQKLGIKLIPKPWIDMVEWKKDQGTQS